MEDEGSEMEPIAKKPKQEPTDYQDVELKPDHESEEESVIPEVGSDIEMSIISGILVW